MIYSVSYHDEEARMLGFDDEDDELEVEFGYFSKDDD